MKSQARLLLDKMNCSQLNIKHKQKPSTQFKLMVLRYNWSLAINKLQKIIIKRCHQPLLNLQEESQNMKKSRSQQPSLLLTNKIFSHLRYHSHVVQSDSRSEEEISTKRQEELESTQKNSNRCEKAQKTVIAQILQTKQNGIKEQVKVSTQSRLDQLKFNEEFLGLFKKQKEVCHFGYLCNFLSLILAQNKVKEQEILIKKILDSRPCKPTPDLKTFLSLIKKPHVEIEQSKPKQQQEFVLHLIFGIFLLIFMSIYIVI
ncbi:unnamed protein product (macronuclear) [Paramecium tetraurelia]|uniref:Transmembrane protein n=1 Tax=Paramecium tetraurelia TaxID=5888 RepID=A0CDT5_PARTE|nr:uncharacterized protein GSPATT00007164001 [Paramecium tetraurelia]CAK68952.1 unnamed protein product [Paramecium tetraurelia]|eukprot:XP_001436349.1 hypothetical protein (macronuclear) [Paramecium tetraurelia strain d4-2]